MALLENTEFAPSTGIDMRGDWGGVVQYGNDRNLVVLFYNRSTHSPQKSQAAGRPVYEDRVYVRVHPPGERLNIVDRPAEGKDTGRWPMQWHQFQQNKQQTPEGTPVGLLYAEKPSIEATLKAHNIHTVEQLADLSEDAKQTVGMGVQQWVNAAKLYLEAANKGVSASKMRAELEERDGQIRVLKQQMDMMRQEMDRLRSSGTTNSGDINDQIQKAIQQVLGGGRPQYPGAGPTAIDPQLAQINATHPTADIAQTAVKPKKVSPQKKGQ